MTTPRRSATTLIVLVVLLAVPPLAGCAPAPRVTEDRTTAPAKPAGSTTRQSQAPSDGAHLVLTDVRVEEGAGRIVLEFSGPGTPGWVVGYVDEPVLDGSGETVPLGGRTVLDVYASGTTWPAPDYYDGPGHVTAPSEVADGVVSDVYVGGTFEGTTQVLAGIDGSDAPFRVRTLADPTRLVIDVGDPDVG